MAKARKTKVFLTDRAIEDLLEIQAYSIEKWGKSATERYLDAFDNFFALEVGRKILFLTERISHECWWGRKPSKTLGKNEKRRASISRRPALTFWASILRRADLNRSGSCQSFRECWTPTKCLTHSATREC